MAAAEVDGGGEDREEGGEPEGAGEDVPGGAGGRIGLASRHGCSASEPLRRDRNPEMGRHHPRREPSDFACFQRSAKIVRLLRRVAGVRQYLTIESRLPMGAGGRCAAAPNLETRSA